MEHVSAQTIQSVKSHKSVLTILDQRFLVIIGEPSWQSLSDYYPVSWYE